LWRRKREEEEEGVFPEEAAAACRAAASPSSFTALERHGAQVQVTPRAPGPQASS